MEAAGIEPYAPQRHHLHQRHTRHASAVHLIARQGPSSPPLPYTPTPDIHQTNILLHEHHAPSMPDDLAEITAAWPRLPLHIKADLMVHVRAAMEEEHREETSDA